MEENKQKILSKANLYTNMAYLLADVAYGYAINIEAYLKQLGMGLKYGEKKQFNDMQRKAHELRQAVTKINSKIYEIEEVDAACNSADFIGDILLLIIDRCGQDENIMQMIRASIFNNYKSRLNIYEYK